MKIRTEFVSNSSSSSFAAIVPAAHGTKFTIEVDLADYGTVLRTKEEVEAVLGGEDIGFSRTYSDQYPGWLYEEALKAVAEGKVVVLGKMTNDPSLGGDRGSKLLYDSLQGVVHGDGVKAYEIG